jgi:hypothetical protein
MFALSNRGISIPTALVAVVLLATPPHLCANVVYPSLPPGSEYQLLFVTSGMRDATSANIADYNAFVTAQAAINPSLPSGITWTAVASTALVAARDNAPNPKGIPVYNTAGTLLCSSTSSLYSGFPLLAAPEYDENGMLRAASVWTGTSPIGTIDDPLGGPTGTASAGFGLSFDTGYWLGRTVSDPTPQLNHYALSSPITVPVPEPSTWALLGMGILGVAAVSGRRKFTHAIRR